MGTLEIRTQLQIPTHCAIINRMRPISCLKPAMRVTKASNAAQLKQNWLDSLSLPPPPCYSISNWVLGIDPDASGALAVLKSDLSAQVFDSPHLPVLVGGRVRKRLDAKSIVMLLRGLDAPTGTAAYIEQSNPYPKDGKQGWWTGGFGYGLWIGILVASGFSVVPVPSLAWKNEFELSGGTCTKDDSRRLASSIFPSLSSQLRRKKDHGRAEALLIAAYGKGLKLETSSEEQLLYLESIKGAASSLLTSLICYWILMIR